MTEPLNVYTCNTFRGHYPVGSAAVVVAVDHEHAAGLLATHLTLAGLPQEVTAEQLDYLCAAHGGKVMVRVLVDGDY